jgi:hypothetical protein
MADLVEKEGERINLDSKATNSRIMAFSVDFEGDDFNEARELFRHCEIMILATAYMIYWHKRRRNF